MMNNTVSIMTSYKSRQLFVYLIMNDDVEAVCTNNLDETNR